MNKYSRLIIIIITALVISSSFIVMNSNSAHSGQEAFKVHPYISNSKNIMKVDNTLALDNNTLFNGSVYFRDFFGAQSLVYNKFNGYLYSYGQSYIEIINISQNKVVGSLSIGVGYTIKQMVYASAEKSIYEINDGCLREIGSNNTFNGNYSMPGKDTVGISYDNLTNALLILFENRYVSSGDQLCLASFNPDTGKLTYDKNFSAGESITGEYYMIFDYKDNSVYISNSYNITVLNLATMKMENITSINFTLFYSMAFDDSNGYIYASNGVNLTVVNTADDKIVGNIKGSTSTTLSSVYYDQNNGQVYSFGERHVYVTSDMNTVGKFEVGIAPTSIIGIKDLTYTMNEGTMNISIEKGMNNEGEIFVGAFPNSAKFDPSNGYVYVDNCYASNVWILNGSSGSIIKNINLTFKPQDILVDTYNGLIYVIGKINGTEYLSEIRNMSLEKTINLGLLSSSVVHMALGGINTIYITDQSYENVNQFSLSTDSFTNISLEGTPGSIVYDPYSSYIFVVNETNNDTYNLTVFKDSKWYKNIPFNSIHDLLYVPENHDVYVSNNTGIYRISQSLSVSTVNGSISKNLYPLSYFSMAYDSQNNILYAGTAGYFHNQDNGYVSSINITSNSLCGVVYDNGESVLNVLTFDNLTGKLFETHIASGGISIISGYKPAPYSTGTQISKKYEVKFIESGLSSGTSWSVTLNGTEQSSTNGTIIFLESNGSYSYSVEDVSGYHISQSSGTVKVNGQNVTISVTFTKISSSTPSTLTYIIIGVAIAIILMVAAGMLYFFKFRK